MIALTVQAHNASLWTLDTDFDYIGNTLPIMRFQPVTKN